MEIIIKLSNGDEQRYKLPSGAVLSSDQLRIIMQRAVRRQAVDVMLD